MFARSALTFVGQSKTGISVRSSVRLYGFLGVAYAGWTDGTEQCRFERPQIKKLFKNRPKCEITLGNEMDLDHFLGPFFDKIINFFDVVDT